MKKIVLILFSFLFTISAYAQEQTVGLFLNKTSAQDGYTLFAPMRSSETYLIDNDGYVVHSWKSKYPPAMSAYLLENGNLLRSLQVSDEENFNNGGKGGGFELFDWDNNLLWRFFYHGTEHRQHHDIEPLPNGNVLLIAWEYKSKEEAIAAGRDSSLLKQNELWPDEIIEVQQISTDSSRIVWEWHFWDHLVQDFDSTKANYGNVKNHPELLDLNFVKTPARANADWTHFNAIDYNPQLDQIVVSSHNTDEIYIIDHSTTTEEAAQHSGGNSGKGGDLLYRWGNPLVYRTGSESDHKIFGQHDAHWIPSGLSGEGHILIFNNGRNRSDISYSSIDEIAPPMDGSGNYLFPDSIYGPASLSWTYSAENLQDFFAKNISGAQRQPNGNTLICSGPTGTFFEVIPTGESVWNYVNPIGTYGPLIQGEPTNTAGNAVFRAYRYAGDYPGLAGKDLSPGAPLEFYTPPFLYPIVDSGQKNYFNDATQIPHPTETEPFYGQDAMYRGYQPTYRDYKNGTILDMNIGLIWQEAEDKQVRNLQDALNYADTLSLDGKEDWRLPSLEELLTLVHYGQTQTRIDTSLFSELPDEANLVYWSNSLSDQTDGRPMTVNFSTGQTEFKNGDQQLYVRCVRGPLYTDTLGIADNGVVLTDSASGLTWQKDTEATLFTWQEALEYAETLTFGGYSDWRLPNVRELYKLAAYYPSSPNKTAVAGAETYWSSTSNASNPAQAWAVDFSGYDSLNNYLAGNIHPLFKTQTQSETGTARVRCVRGGGISITGIRETRPTFAADFTLEQNFPNPFNPSTTIRFNLKQSSDVSLIIYNMLGQKIRTLINGRMTAGKHQLLWNGKNSRQAAVSSGVYFYQLKSGSQRIGKKMLLVR